MIVKKRASCFGVVDGETLFIMKQVFESCGTCPITGTAGTWIDGQEIKSVWRTGTQLQWPSPKETMRRLRGQDGCGPVLLNCSSCWNRSYCQHNVYAKRVYEPVCEGKTIVNDQVREVK